ncbi:MAG: hypothetical protein ACM3ML_02565 [Micromonosporaceae bacterium]
MQSCVLPQRFLELAVRLGQLGQRLLALLVLHVLLASEPGDATGGRQVNRNDDDVDGDVGRAQMWEAADLRRRADDRHGGDGGYCLCR